MTPKTAALLCGVSAYPHWFDTCLTFGELILLNRRSEKPQPVKSKVFLTAVKAKSVQQGLHELAQGKGKNHEEEEKKEGRPLSSMVTNSQFKAAQHTFNSYNLKGNTEYSK